MPRFPNSETDSFLSYILAVIVFLIGTENEKMRRNNPLISYTETDYKLQVIFIEDTEHFLLLCPYFDVHRRDLLAGIFALLRPLGYVDLANEFLLQLLLYGDKDFPDSVNRHILELTLYFIHKTVQFD